MPARYQYICNQCGKRKRKRDVVNMPDGTWCTRCLAINEGKPEGGSEESCKRRRTRRKGAGDDGERFVAPVAEKPKGRVGWPKGKPRSDIRDQLQWEAHRAGLPTPKPNYKPKGKPSSERRKLKIDGCDDDPVTRLMVLQGLWQQPIQKRYCFGFDQQPPHYVDAKFCIKVNGQRMCRACYGKMQEAKNRLESVASVVEKLLKEK